MKSNRRVTIYRDDSTVQVAYDNVKTTFWIADNTVLVVSQYTGEGGEHRYVHWPRERFCWFKDEKVGQPPAAAPEPVRVNKDGSAFEPPAAAIGPAWSRDAERYAARRRTIFETRCRLQVGGPRPAWEEFVKEYDAACDKEAAAQPLPDPVPVQAPALPLKEDPDARRWAAEFAAVRMQHPLLPTDEGWLIGWFANAIECGRAVERRRRSLLEAGDEVWVHDRYRFAVRLRAVVKTVSQQNDGVEVTLLDSNNVQYPIGCDTWVHAQQLTRA